MTDTALPVTEPKKRRSTKLRSVAVGTLGVLAVIGIIVSTLAVWTRVTLFNSDKVADAATSTLDDPAVAAELANYVTDQVFVAVDVNQLVANVVPGNAPRLNAVVVRQARTVVATEVARLLGTDRFQDVFHQL